MHLPTLRQLQFLTALADHGSFSRAAEASLVAQPTLSAAIKDIETLLGTQLVEREARGARLTAAGELAVEQARRILADAEELVTRARGAGAPLTGPFRLGAIPTIAPFVLPGALKGLRTAYPDLKLYLREDKTADLLAALRTRTLDAAIIALPWTTPGIETLTLGDDPFLLASPHGHRLIDKPKLGVRDLAGENVLLLEEGHCMRDHALSVCAMPGVERQDDLAATSLQTMVQMVAGGLGISLIPKIAAEAGLANGIGVDVRAFTETAPTRQISVAWRMGSSREAEARLIGDVIQAALGKA